MVGVHEGVGLGVPVKFGVVLRETMGVAEGKTSSVGVGAMRRADAMPSRVTVTNTVNTTRTANESTPINIIRRYPLPLIGLKRILRRTKPPTSVASAKWTEATNNPFG